MEDAKKGFLTLLDEDDVICEADSLLAEFGIDYSQGYVYCGDSNECYSEVVEIFCEICEELEDNLKKTLADGNMSEYAVHVHGLKGNAKSLGAVKLAELAYSHEMKSKAGDIEFCRNNWDDLHAEWMYVIKGLHKYLWAMDMYDGEV